MKKISVLLLIAIMLFAFVACEEKTPDPDAIPEDAVYVSDVAGLQAALKAQENGTFIVLKEGTYDVSSIDTGITVGSYSNFFIPVTKNDVTIMAEPGADVTISVGASAEAVGSWDTQSIVVVMGDNATIEGIDFSVRNASGYPGKTIEIVGSNATVKDCSFASGTNSGILVDSVVYITDVAAEPVEGVTVEGCVFEADSWLDFAGEVSGTIVIRDNTFKAEASIGIHGEKNGSWAGDIDLTGLSAPGNTFEAGSYVWTRVQDASGTGVTGFDIDDFGSNFEDPDTSTENMEKYVAN